MVPNEIFRAGELLERGEGRQGHRRRDVDGRTAYVLRWSERVGPPHWPTIEMTLWVDKETYAPLKFTDHSWGKDAAGQAARPDLHRDHPRLQDAPRHAGEPQAARDDPGALNAGFSGSAKETHSVAHAGGVDGVRMSTLAFDQPRRRRAALARPSLAALTARPELIALLAIAGVLNLWALDLNGWANDYYAAAVRSMTTSWHAFLYGAYDVAGLQTVDKPPLALWVQALQRAAFGFNSWSILVPQALMGVATVGLVYDLARSRFGRAAGTVAGLTLALTPITVAISRHNNPDALLVLCIMAALWALDRGLRRGGSMTWLMAAGAFVGLGFETKMAAALLVVPGMVAAWLWVAPRGRLARAAPAARGRRGDGGGRARLAAADVAHARRLAAVRLGHRRQLDLVADPGLQRPRAPVRAGRRAGRRHGRRRGGVFGGATGPLRLLNEALGGQAGWFLGFAVVAAIALAVSTRLRRDDARTGWLIAVGAAFAVTAITFSRASGIFHPYYVAALAPFTALLVGGGFSLLTRARSPGRWCCSAAR